MLKQDGSFNNLRKEKKMPGIWDQIKAGAKQLSDAGKKQFGQLKNKSVSEGLMAACALTAAANGELKDSEIEAVMATIKSNPWLQDYDPSQLVQRFKYFCTQLRGPTKAIGKVTCQQAISKNKGVGEAPDIIIAICCAIGAADGDFDDNEKAIVREMCGWLGTPVPPAAVGSTSSPATTPTAPAPASSDPDDLRNFKF
ncbi:MAG: TerB family tellurite resistance protein [Patescibacteria group bacterium]